METAERKKDQKLLTRLLFFGLAAIAILSVVLS